MTFVTTAVLARLLSPSDFGLVGMAMVITAFITVFKDLGTAAAVIQRKKLSETLLSSIFWVNTVFGFIMMVLLFALASVCAGVYHEPRIAPLLRMLSVTFFISGITIVHQAIQERNLSFGKLAKIELISTFFGAFVGIGLALLKAGVWSLVYQTVAITSMTTLLLVVMTPWRPKLVFQWSEVKSVSNYTMNLTGFSLINYFSRNADYLLIGRFLGTEALGYYMLAYRIMLYPLQNISAVIGRVVYPAYSQMQDDNERFGRAYVRVVGAVALVTFPLMIGVMVLCKPFIISVFGRAWIPSAAVLAILAPVGMWQSIGTLNGIIYRAKGRTDLQLYVGSICTAIFVTTFAVGLRWGIIGVAVGYTIMSALLAVPNLLIACKLINLNIMRLAEAVWRSFVCSILMGVVIFELRRILTGNLEVKITLISSVMAGLLIYAAATWFINRQQISSAITAAKSNGQ